MDVALVIIKLLCARELATYFLHQWLTGHQVAIGMGGHLDHQCVALAKLRLEVLRAAQTFELPVDHDGNACAQSITLLHAEKGMQKNSALTQTLTEPLGHDPGDTLHSISYTNELLAMHVKVPKAAVK